MWVYWTKEQGDCFELPRFLPTWSQAAVCREFDQSEGLRTSGIYYCTKEASARNGEFEHAGGVIPTPTG